MHQPKTEIVDVILPLEKSEDEVAQRRALSRKLNVPPKAIYDIRLRKHSIDARKSQLKVQLRFEVGIGQELPEEPSLSPDYPAVPSEAKRVVIVGCGPAGLFAALRAIERGWKPIILERGKDASARRFDLRPILKQGTVIEESNYCFGEGGAGTFSDGKLYTRATKRGPVMTVYETLVAHGAPERILIDAHPHIGSNLLPNVVKAMRESIRSAGGEVHFEKRVTDFILENGKARGVVTHDDDEIVSDAVILATGHSARDIYQLLEEKKIRTEPKAFAVGVRIEHPQSLIDEIQYHLGSGNSRSNLLPAASYGLATKIRGRGVHSFCMCPGGFIVPAATKNDEVVVNGMSLAKRDSPFANSGMVVTVEPKDVPGGDGVAFQKKLEQAAKIAGGGGQVAPGQRLIDFLDGRASTAENLNPTSYTPGIAPARLDEILPKWIVNPMRDGLRLFGKQMRGYIGEQVNLIGFETRTSSPVRIPRDDNSLQHPDVPGFFPCGEGAGYAGGIVSAALDGMRCADAL